MCKGKDFGLEILDRKPTRTYSATYYDSDNSKSSYEDDPQN